MSSPSAGTIRKVRSGRRPVSFPNRARRPRLRNSPTAPVHIRSAPGDPIARRFLIAATSVIFGVATFTLLVQSGLETISYIDHGAGKGDGPGSLLAGLIVALTFWGSALAFLRRELSRPD